jgi:hypothetical protein
VAHSDPAGAADAAWAAADVLAVTARLVEGRRTGPLGKAADQFERAAREVYRRTPPPTDAGHGLRNASTMLPALRAVSHGETRQLLALMAQLARLVDAVAALRHTQQRAAQAAAARAAAEQLREALAVRAVTPGGTAAVARQAPPMTIHGTSPKRPAPGAARR